MSKDYVEHIRHSKELDKQIIRAIAAGQSLEDICSQDGMPAIYTLQRWINERIKFRRMFVQAVAHGMTVRAEESIKLPELIMDALGRGDGRDQLSAVKVYVASKQKAIANYCNMMQKVLNFFADERNMVDELGNKIEQQKQIENKDAIDLKKLLEGDD